MSRLTRRRFMKLGAGACATLCSPMLLGCGDESNTDSDNSGSYTPDDDDSNSVGGFSGQADVHAILGDELSELYVMAKQAADVLGINGKNLLGSTVFIKPNFVSLGLGDRGFLGETGECTKAEIVAGIAECCLEAGAGKVIIGDGAQGLEWAWDIVNFLPGNMIHGAVNLASAVQFLKDKYGDGKIELQCLNLVDQWERVPSCSDDPDMADGLMVARPFYEADHVISLPVIKSHMWANFTGSMKNLVGITPITHLGTGFVRHKVHNAYAHVTCEGVSDVGIAGAFVDMLRWRVEQGKQDFAILDCSIGVEGSGPHTPPVNKGITIDIKQRSNLGKYFLLAGTDWVAIDTVMANLIQVQQLSKIKQLVLAEKLGLGRTKNIRIRGANLEDLRIPNWEKPREMSEDFFSMFERIWP
jgi:uncharacterized protein (DUF362 family)